MTLHEFGRRLLREAAAEHDLGRDLLIREVVTYLDIDAKIELIVKESSAMEPVEDEVRKLGWNLHEVLGLREEAYEARLDEDRRTGGPGVPVSLEPRFHRHPVLGIIGHSHGTVAESRTLHVHSPVVGWDFTPIQVVPGPPPGPPQPPEWRGPRPVS